MATQHKPERNRLLARVHIAKKELGMDDDVYRDIICNRWNKHSARDLEIHQLKELISYFIHLGWDGGKKPAKGPKKSKSRGWVDLPTGINLDRQKRYVAALWAALGYKMSGLDYRCKKQFGVDRFRWLNDQDQIQTLAKDLVNRCKKRGIEHRAEYH
ncbi:MAG: phage protein GemA/Gp16 family protein [Thermodesulfobacteriota bacterium]|nr:phage protein GemA/Gp16 family protein [Thermodesulfobacteriota bacterium]